MKQNRSAVNRAPIAASIQTQKIPKRRLSPAVSEALLTASFFIFLLTFAIFATTWYLSRHGNFAANHPLKRKEASTSAPQLFYRSVGTTPASPQHPHANQSQSANGDQSNAAMALESYTLEIKLTHSRGEAEREVASLNARGIDAYYTPLQRGPQVVYRVRRGIFPDESLAARASAILQTEKGLKTKVVRL